MKTLATKGIYFLSLIVLLLGATLQASAQYTGTTLETGGLYTALAKDASGNVYETRVKTGTSGATYAVYKYTNGTGTPALIYQNLTHEVDDFPWGLAVTSTGNIFIATDFTTSSGRIIKLTYNSSANTYAGSVYQTGRFFTALAVDASDNVYDTEYDATNKTYAVVRYPANSTNNYAGVTLYDNLKSGVGYNYPTGLAVNATGDVYVADAFSNVPTITDGGHVYKLTKASSYAVSTVSTAQYSSALAVDANGNLYSSENSGSGYNLVKYIGGTGTAVLAYKGLHTNGIYYPWGIAITGVNKIYAIDGDDGTHGGSVITISADAPTVTTSAATSVAATTATLNGQVNDNANATTVSFVYGTSSTLAGATTVPATTGGNIAAGTGNTNVAVSLTGLKGSSTYYYQVSATNSIGTTNGAILSFSTPPSVSYPGPDVYVTGTAVTLTPTSSTVPTGAYGTPYAIGTSYPFANPFGVAVDAAGNVYVAGDGNETLLKIPAGGGPVVTIANGFGLLVGVAVDAAGNVYASDESSAKVEEFIGGTGTPVLIGSGYTTPYGIAVDAAGNVYVADFGAAAVVKVAAGGATQANIGSGFTHPVGVTVDVSGNVFVADYGAGQVYKIPGGTGTPVIYGSGFSQPTGVAVNAAGNVFVADYGNNAIKKIPVGGGTPVAIGSGFTQPSDVAVDGAGNIYVADFSNNAVKEITPTGGYYVNNPLPKGLSMNGNTGVITGTPTTSTPAANYIITAYNTAGSTSATVNIKVVSNNAALSKLQINSGTLTPVFATGTTSYTVSVPYATASVKVAATTTDPNATVTINGTAVASGVPSGSIALSVGQNTITTVVTAQDGVTTDTYTITVTRGAPATVASLSNLVLSNGTLSPAFATTTYSYSTSVGYGLSTMTVTPTVTDPNSTVTVNGQAVTSGSASQVLPLTPGANSFNIVVTAQDGVTTKTYTLVINEAHSSNDNLAGLGLSAGTLSPAFAATTTSYTTTVNYSVNSFSVTPTTADPNATVTVNGTAVASGSASPNTSLNQGSNVFTIVVTAANAATKTYTLTVTRSAPSNNPNLTGLTISNGTLSPAFASGTTGYSTSVGSGLQTFTVTPTASNVYETITVNGTAVTSGSASQYIPLTAGANTVTIFVTAQDGVTTKTYTLTVNEAKSTNDNLFSLKTSGGFSQGQTVPAIMSENVASTLTNITITPTTADATATVTVNGGAVTSGTASPSFALAVGGNSFTIIVTAQSGATKSYSLTVTRAGGADNNVYQPVGVAEPLNTIALANDGITVHQGVSPNGDGIDDFLQIDNITNYPDNKLAIMDRNGMLVYEMKGYDNSSKVFDGHSNKNGQMQLPGTYFYLLDYAVNGVTKHKTGFIVLKY